MCIRMTTPFIFSRFSRTDTDTETKVTKNTSHDTSLVFGPNITPLSPKLFFFLLPYCWAEHNLKPTTPCLVIGPDFARAH